MREQHARQTVAGGSILPLIRVKLPSSLKRISTDRRQPRKIKLSTTEVKALRRGYLEGPVALFVSAKQNLRKTSNIAVVIESLRGVKKSVVEYANTSIRDVLAVKIGVVFVRSPGDFSEDFKLKPEFYYLKDAIDGAIFNLANIEAELHQQDGYVETTRVVMFLNIIWSLVDYIDREIRELEAKAEAGLNATDFTFRHPQALEYYMTHSDLLKKKQGKAKKTASKPSRRNNHG